MGKTLTRADIGAAKDLEIVEVPIPEWGGSVYVRMLTAKERIEFEIAITDAEGNLVLRNSPQALAKLCVLTMCDAEGNRLYDDTPESVNELNGRRASTLIRIADAAKKLNALEADEVEGIAKN